MPLFSFLLGNSFFWETLSFFFLFKSFWFCPYYITLRFLISAVLPLCSPDLLSLVPDLPSYSIPSSFSPNPLLSPWPYVSLASPSPEAGRTLLFWPIFISAQWWLPYQVAKAKRHFTSQHIRLWRNMVMMESSAGGHLSSFLLPGCQAVVRVQRAGSRQSSFRYQS